MYCTQVPILGDDVPLEGGVSLAMDELGIVPSAQLRTFFGGLGAGAGEHVMSPPHT